jgi:hypothetical protein
MYTQSPIILSFWWLDHARVSIDTPQVVWSCMSLYGYFGDLIMHTTRWSSSSSSSQRVSPQLEASWRSLQLPERMQFIPDVVLPTGGRCLRWAQISIVQMLGWWHQYGPVLTCGSSSRSRQIQRCRWHQHIDQATLLYCWAPEEFVDCRLLQLWKLRLDEMRFLPGSLTKTTLVYLILWWV